MKQVKRWICLVLAVFAVVGAAVGILAVREQTALSEKIVRLHVRANSDSAEDQRIKCSVRDAVLLRVRDLTDGCESADKTLLALKNGLPLLAQTAAQTLRRHGVTDSVTVRLCREPFPTRAYDTFSLPAGAYTALRVDIGEAAGHNWWCVVFPTLCMSATTEGMEAAAAAAGFSDKELSLIEDDSPQVQVKFRVLEWLSALFQ